ncbi:hypothetical protein [Marinilabilia sp.]|uniref:hypothetical protein n=1 Tax=Marinilabilia sp. TaxID=2021252 RepID=UPI0025BC8F81|nr:hypothetical protein [Marinilabilia sp.]
MVKKATFIIFIYVLLVFAFWIFIGSPVMNGDINFKFYSDSRTYERLALSTNNLFNLLRVSGNQIGPVFIAKLIGPENYTGIFLLNFAVLMLAIKFFLKNDRLQKDLFLILILFNPITFTSIFSINKEIFLFLSLSFLVRFVEDKKYKWIIFAVVLSLIIRWQLTLFFLVVFGIASPINFLRNRKFLFFFLFLGAISFVLSVTRNTIFGDVFYVYEQAISDKVGGPGLFDKIMDIQDSYGYVVAFVPKAFHLLVGMTKRVNHLFNPDPVEMYNDVVLFWLGPINLFLLVVFFYRRLFSLKDPLVFLSLIYISIFAITPIYNIRYFYPVTIFLSYIISRKRESNKWFSSFGILSLKKKRSNNEVSII